MITFKWSYLINQVNNIKFQAWTKLEQLKLNFVEGSIIVSNLFERLWIEKIDEADEIRRKKVYLIFD